MQDPDPCIRPTQVPARLTGTASWYVGRAALRAQQNTYEQLSGAGFRKWHYGVLAVVAEVGPTTQAEIGRRLGVDRSDMVTLLGDLEAAGYVHRETDPADRRRNRVTITEPGKRALVELDAYVLEANDRLLAPLSAAERQQLLHLLRRVVEAPQA